MTAGISLLVLLVILGSSIAVAAGMGLTGVVLQQLYSTMPIQRMYGEPPGRPPATSFLRRSPSHHVR